MELLVGPSIVTGNTGRSVPSDAVPSDAANAVGVVVVDWIVATVVAAGSVGVITSASDGETSEDSSDNGIVRCRLDNFK